MYTKLTFILSNSPGKNTLKLIYRFELDQSTHIKICAAIASLHNIYMCDILLIKIVLFGYLFS